MKRGLTPQAKQELLQEVSSIYAQLAERPLARQCTGLAQCCRFRLTGATPFLTRGEALVAATAIRRSGRKKLPAAPDGSCPLLGPDARCTIYEDRPFGCRTHFCKPAGGPYPRAAVRDLIQRLDEIDSRLGGQGPMYLPTALEQALSAK